MMLREKPGVLRWRPCQVRMDDVGDVLGPGERSICDSPAGPIQNGRPMLLGGECRDGRDEMTLCLG